MRVIAEDLSCGHCDYNLRGLAEDGACPECGTGVASTLRGLSTAPAAWLRRVSLGAALIGGGMLIGSAGIAATVKWREPWVLYLFPAGAVVAAAGTWMFATPRGRAAGAVELSLRVMVVATCALQLFSVYLFARAMGFWGPRPVGPYSETFAAAQFSALVWATAALLTFVRAARVARQVGDRPGVVQAWALALLNVVTLLAGAAIWSQSSDAGVNVRFCHIGASIAASTWSTVFFFGFAVVLWRATDAATIAARVRTSAGESETPGESETRPAAQGR